MSGGGVPSPRRWTLEGGACAGFPLRAITDGPEIGVGEAVEVMPVAEHQQAVAGLVEEIDLVAEQRDGLAAENERLEAELARLRDAAQAALTAWEKGYVPPDDTPAEVAFDALRAVLSSGAASQGEER